MGRQDGAVEPEDAERGADEAGRDAAALAEVRGVLAEAVARLQAAGVPDEPLAEFVPARRVLGVTRRSRLVPLGRVWRLGVFLLDHEARLYAAGATTRAVPPGHPQYVAASQEQRREYRAAAYRGHFAPGETVNHSARPLELAAATLREATGPLLLDDGRALVRWSPGLAGTSAVPFRPYLEERVELAVHPPEGA